MSENELRAWEDIAIVRGLEPLTIALGGIDIEVVAPKLDHPLVKLRRAERRHVALGRRHAPFEDERLGAAADAAEERPDHHLIG